MKIYLHLSNKFICFRFAELTAAIFVQANYPVYLFSTVVPTPFVPFTVTKLKCIVGIMVTASHNPKEDNGYKVNNLRIYNKKMQRIRIFEGSKYFHGSVL